MNTVARDASWRDMKTLTASGFRDTTRLAAESGDASRYLDDKPGSVGRWLDAFIATLSDLRQALASDEGIGQVALDAYLNEARDARALWATQTTREGELLQGTSAELQPEGVSEHMVGCFSVVSPNDYDQCPTAAARRRLQNHDSS